MPRSTQLWGADGQPDFYCDANADDPNLKCAEVDVQEASAYAYHAVSVFVFLLYYNEREHTSACTSSSYSFL